MWAMLFRAIALRSERLLLRSRYKGTGSVERDHANFAPLSLLDASVSHIHVFYVLRSPHISFSIYENGRTRRSSRLQTSPAKVVAM